MAAERHDDTVQVGIIGGSGLYDLEALTGVREVRVTTPYGDPSDALIVGSLGGIRVAFLPRHGRRHQIVPTHVPARANIYALKSLGVRQLISVSAVGSLREDFRPGDLVTPDQIVDRTRGRKETTFFDENIVVHVPFGEPFCGRLRGLLGSAARRATDAAVHASGTYCCMEGPQFSTRAESELYRSWGLDIIGMTAVPEAKLAREAELCYAGLALVTDYDCWRAETEDVSASGVAEVMRRNSAAAKASMVALLESLDPEPKCGCQDALAASIITPLDAVSEVTRDRHKLLVGKYFATEAHRPAA
ncbi:S-methyl-5'-thioadenosine phosphorylase [Streptomyces sp. NPDC000151]|uniref:S-methyl-5'-thioadenosine phosphorylase n=1 Tax=Streptomyces sp. NPDC000151 TaxID=3154244 RepID=UPI00332344C5